MSSSIENIYRTEILPTIDELEALITEIRGRAIDDWLSTYKKHFTVRDAEKAERYFKIAAKNITNLAEQLKLEGSGLQEHSEE